MNELQVIEGSNTRPESMAYIPQTPWLSNSTVKDNILFGEAMELEWYDQVIQMCELKDDFSIFPAGDLTEIGERGINLSGG